MKKKSYHKYTLIIYLLLSTISCSSFYVKPTLYKLDIHDPDFEKKARYNELETQQAQQENDRRKKEHDRQKAILKLWLD